MMFPAILLPSPTTDGIVSSASSVASRPRSVEFWNSVSILDTVPTLPEGTDATTIGSASVLTQDLHTETERAIGTVSAEEKFVSPQAVDLNLVASPTSAEAPLKTSLTAAPVEQPIMQVMPAISASGDTEPAVVMHTPPPSAPATQVVSEGQRPQDHPDTQDWNPLQKVLQGLAADQVIKPRLTENAGQAISTPTSIAATQEAPPLLAQTSPTQRSGLSSGIQETTQQPNKQAIAKSTPAPHLPPDAAKPIVDIESKPNRGSHSPELTSLEPAPKKTQTEFSDGPTVQAHQPKNEDLPKLQTIKTTLSRLIDSSALDESRPTDPTRKDHQAVSQRLPLAVPHQVQIAPKIAAATPLKINPSVDAPEDNIAERPARLNVGLPEAKPKLPLSLHSLNALPPSGPFFVPKAEAKLETHITEDLKLFSDTRPAPSIFLNSSSITVAKVALPNTSGIAKGVSGLPDPDFASEIEFGLGLDTERRFDPAPHVPNSTRPLPHPTHSPAIAVQLREALGSVPSQSKTIEIALKPEELGSVRIAMTPTDLGGSVVIMVERPETLDLVQRHLESLRRDLRDAGWENVEMFLSRDGGASGSQADSQQSQDQSAPLNMPWEGKTSPTDDESPVVLGRPPAALSAGLDLRI